MKLPTENLTHQARKTESEIFRPDMQISECATPDLPIIWFFVWQMLWVPLPGGLGNYAYPLQST